MKEAAGEANMTVITIVLIGVIAAIAIPMVSSLMGNAGRRTCCTDSGGVWSGGSCTAAKNGSGVYDTSNYSKCISNL